MKTDRLEMRWSRHLATALTALVALFLTLYAVMTLVGAPPAIATTGELGFSAQATHNLGPLLSGATLLYVVPATRVLGAILLNGYLGRTVALQAAHGSPLATHVLFEFYIGIGLWASIWLRDDGLRQLFPLQRSYAR